MVYHGVQSWLLVHFRLPQKSSDAPSLGDLMHEHGLTHDVHQHTLH